MFVVHTSNCHGQNCTRRAIFRLGINTLIANILVSFFPTHFFRRLQTDIFETFPHDVALPEKEALLCRFPNSTPNKNELQLSPNLASNRNILWGVTRNVEGK